MTMEMTLKEEFEQIANKYANKLVEMYFFEKDCDKPYFYWVSDEAGSILAVSDYYFNFDDIRYIVDNNVPFDTWLDWYDYNLAITDLDIKAPNLKSWYVGCPRLTKEQLVNMFRLRQGLDKTV